MVASDRLLEEVGCVILVIQKFLSSFFFNVTRRKTCELLRWKIYFYIDDCWMNPGPVSLSLWCCKVRNRVIGRVVRVAD